MFYFNWILFFGENLILKSLPDSKSCESYIHLHFVSESKRWLSPRSPQDQASEEIATYGEIQQDYHEGCPPTFAPPSI